MLGLNLRFCDLVPPATATENSCSCYQLRLLLLLHYSHCYYYDDDYYYDYCDYCDYYDYYDYYDDDYCY